MLNFEVILEIKYIGLRACTTSSMQNNVISIEIADIYTKLKLHESKTMIGVSLTSIEIKDTFYKYKYEKLEKFLYTTRRQEEDMLIDIQVCMMTDKHPKYNFVDTDVTFTFGKLTCNYKP
eukprot:GHVR01002361.1.p1 GENE.GHVR01002361.1~~GHVR01002361.1.p1  ORF type:complete len:120 (-),score=2.41 GHVR01002361.1:1234-1593(-)